MHLEASDSGDDVLAGRNLNGLRVLVTGASAGLGLATAKALAAHGANVIGAVRDLDKTRRAFDQAGVNSRSGASIDIVELDLASLDSVRNCADGLLSQNVTIDVVIANAGIMAAPYARTLDGFELHFGTNHLGHFVLVNRLAPTLRKPGSRVVVLTSAGHRRADVDLDDPSFDRCRYNEFDAYGRSKTANILFAVEFDRRHRAEGVRACAVYPGTVKTELGRFLTPVLIEQLGSSGLTYRSINQGIATVLWAAVVASSVEIGSRYCEDCAVAEIETDPNVRRGVRPYALDPARATALWRVSETLVEETFSA